MSRSAQAPAKRNDGGRRQKAPAAALVLCALALLQGCASGFSLKEAEVDRSLYTSALPPGQNAAPPDAHRISDEVTIRNAVSSADIESQKTLPWANADTGARGAITDVAEYKQAGLLCRRFTTTRESFDGVRLFKGNTCMAGAGDWHMQAFEAL